MANITDLLHNLSIHRVNLTAHSSHCVPGTRSPSHIIYSKVQRFDLARYGAVGDKRVHLGLCCWKDSKDSSVAMLG